MEPTWTYDSLTTLTGGHTPPQLGQRGGWNGVRHGHRGIITHHKWPQVFRVTAVLDKSENSNQFGMPLAMRVMPSLMSATLKLISRPRRLSARRK
jgi:hypothetical protein